MLFNSLHFLIFFPVVCVAYFALPQRWRWGLLLAASVYFYMSWRAEYIVLLLVSTLFDYWAGLKMGATPDQARRKRYLVLSLGANLAILFIFKYFNFFNASVRTLFDGLGLAYAVPAINLLLPVGISFYTFHAMSYTIDVYRGLKQPERHIGKFLLYILFFPQLVAGPISRPRLLLPQFHQPHYFDPDRVASGLALMAWGFFKKLVIADRLAVIVNNVYNSPTEHSGLTLVLATYSFAFQIYCDFSGYSDIALGAARILGYDLMENFRRPYASTSVAEFWSRWHISLSTWFRDYLYVPLGGNRVPRARWYFNLLFVFLVSGLWHGANWTFVIWGALHGLYLLAEIWTQGPRGRLTQRLGLDRHPGWLRALSMLLTFHLVTLAWIFFRANTLGDALYIVGHLFEGWSLRGGFGLGVGVYELAIAAAALALMELVQWLQARGVAWPALAARPGWQRWATYYALGLAILIFGKFGTTEFIYFQF
jgi:alginate O-acetyltransferase complex protein AlgI